MLQAQVIRYRFQSVGIIGDQDFCAHHPRNVPNPLLGVERRFRLQYFKVQGFTRQDGSRDGHDLVFAFALDMRKVHAKNFDLTALVLPPLPTEFNRALPCGLDILIDRAFAQGILSRVEEVGDAWITQTQDIEQDTQAFECIRLLSV